MNTIRRRICEVGLVALFVAIAVDAAAVIPGQFISKMYTEALGRAPDDSGWESAVSYFEGAGCNAASLKQFGSGILLSAEFANLQYTTTQRVSVLFRSVLSREVGQLGYNTYKQRLDDLGYSWETVVGQVFDSEEFAGSASFVGLHSVICSDGRSFDGYSMNAPITVPVESIGFSGEAGGKTANDLAVALLLAAPSCGTVYLAHNAIVRLTATVPRIVIPSCVTLTTFGFAEAAGTGWSRQAYARMGRLLRWSNTDVPTVEIDPGGKLVGVWVSGQVHRDVDGTVIEKVLGDSRAPILTRGTEGPRTVITKSRVDDSPSGTHIAAKGSIDGTPCRGSGTTRGLAITDNLVTGYANRSFDPQLWADGITLKCEDADVLQNDVIDATDGGILVFRGGAPTTRQRSRIQSNRILNAGNSAFWGVGVTAEGNPPNETPPPPSNQWYDFSGTLVAGNTIWTAPVPHIDVPVVVGTRILFGNTAFIGKGATIQNNTSAGHFIRAQVGVYSGGFADSIVQNNMTPPGSLLLIDNEASNPNGATGDVWMCSALSASTVAISAVSSGWATPLQQPYSNIDWSGCLAGDNFGGGC